jgi:putative hemolysin
LILVATGAGIYLFSVSKNKSINDKDATVVISISPTESPVANMANPASVYCNEHNGKSVIRTASDGSQSGVCVFADGNECDEWMYFRGECSPNDSPTPGTQKAVQAFLANKYKKPLSEVKVTIQKEAPGYASGSVSFGQDDQGGGGMWLAVAGNQWDVVWDGNGSVDCTKLRQQYGFPDSILKPNFCD